MGIKKFLREFEQKVPVKLLIIICTIGPALIMAYNTFLADKHPQLYYDILTSASVLDIKEDLPELDILFDGIDIRQQNQALRIFSIKVINDSSKNILENYYSQDDPLGLLVSTGKIIKADISETSHDHLRKTVSIRSGKENIIYFKAVILDAHQYYVAKLLVLHPIGEIPVIEPVGYISGMKSINVREVYKEKEKQTFWSKNFAGSWTVQAYRLIGYFILALGILIILDAILSPLNKFLSKSIRRSHITEFKKSTTLILTEKDDFIFSRYIESGYPELRIIQHIIKDEETLSHYLKRVELARSSSELYLYSRVASRIKTVSLEFSILGFIDDLITNGLVSITDVTSSIDSHMKETLLGFLDYLKEHRLVNKKNLKDDHFIISEKLSIK